MDKNKLLKKFNLTSKRLSEAPDHTLLGIIKMPLNVVSPGVALLRRLAFAFGILFLAAIVVYLDRSGYKTTDNRPLNFLDCLYYSTVSLSTTGYGDISPITNPAKLTDIILITPLRVIFLAVLVSSTLSVLTERSRQAIQIQRWRKTVKNHNIIIGFGTKGKTAASTMIGEGVSASEIVVVDTNNLAIADAERLGLVTVIGDATKEDILTLAGVANAKAVVIATNRDDTSVLVTLTAKQIAPQVSIVAAIREAENSHLFKHAGANSVVISSETTGRLLGVATKMPTVVDLIEDFLTPDNDFSIAQREVQPHEFGSSPRHLPEIVIGVVREDKLYRSDDPQVESVSRGDSLLYLV